MEKTALSFDDDGRVYACDVYPDQNYDGMIIIDKSDLPEGDLLDYKYVDGEFVYDPIPKEVLPESEPTTEDIMNALLGVV